MMIMTRNRAVPPQTAATLLVLDMTWSRQAQCVTRGQYLCELMAGGQCASPYTARYFAGPYIPQPGYRVLWSNYYVLATDYNT